MACQRCNYSDWSKLPDGTYQCSDCGQTYYAQSGRTSIKRRPPQATAPCPGCEAAARELADIKSDKAWADKLSAENADELSNLRREHDDLRARLAAECDAVRAKAMDEDDDYYIIAERFRALLAETEAK